MIECILSSNLEEKTIFKDFINIFSNPGQMCIYVK